MIPAKRDPNAKVEKVIEHVPIERVVEDLHKVANSPRNIDAGK